MVFKKATKQSKLPWKLIYCSCVLWLFKEWKVRSPLIHWESFGLGLMQLLVFWNVFAFRIPRAAGWEPSVICYHTNALLWLCSHGFWIHMEWSGGWYKSCSINFGLFLVASHPPFFFFHQKYMTWKIDAVISELKADALFNF